jgi:N-acetyl-gamma-glutamyl-phosphate reductase
VPDVAVLGATGYAGAVAAALLHRHPHFALTHVTARAEAGERLDDVHPRTRVPLALEPFDPAAPCG